MSIVDFETKYRECLKEYEKVGNQYAEAKAQSWQLQEMKSAVFSSEFLSAEGKTIGEREAKAKTSEAYLRHIEGTAVAIEKETALKVKLEKISMTYEALRSLCSQQTQSMKFGG
jgi:flagellar basal body rod protein FlgB